MHDRDAEDGHHGVADELLHGAAVPLDDRLHALEATGEQRPERLRVELLAELRRTGYIAEEHRHDLALLARASRRGGYRGAAKGAERKLAWEFLPAGGTGRDHAAESKPFADNAKKLVRVARQPASVLRRRNVMIATARSSSTGGNP